jgi:hypothetical protein
MPQSAQKKWTSDVIKKNNWKTKRNSQKKWNASKKQGSMQLHGEVMELAIEEWLASNFP